MTDSRMSGDDRGGRLERKDADFLVRGWNLLFNRCLSYSYTHPLVQETIPRICEVFLEAQRRCGGSLNILLQEGMFFIDSADVVYQPSNRRIADHLRRFGVESLTMQPGFDASDFKVLIDACSLTHPDPNAFLAYCQQKGGRYLQVNQVSLRAIREGDVVSAVGMSSVPPISSLDGDLSVSGAGQASGEHSFEDIVLKAMVGRLTAQELENNVVLAQMLADPQSMGRAAIEGTAGLAPQSRNVGMGQMVLNVLSHFSTQQAKTAFSVEELLEGLFSMRGEMLRMVKAQRSLEEGLSEDDVEQATDTAFHQTVCQIITDEYRSSRGNLKRVAHVLGRVVTSRRELRRILPRLKDALLGAGCTLPQWYDLVSDLSVSLHDDKAIQDLADAAADFGVSAEDVLGELRRDPKSAAKLLLVAGEIRAGGGNLGSDASIQAMLEALDQTGDRLIEKMGDQPSDAVEMTRLVGRMQTEIREDLGKRDLTPQVRQTLERKVDLRVNRMMGEMKARTFVTQLRRPDLGVEEKAGVMAELVKDEQEADSILGLALSLLGPDEVAGNVGRQIAEKVKARLRDERERLASRELPQGVYPKAVAEFFLRYETRRCTRYGVPFSVMLVSFQGLSEDKTSLDQHGPSLRGLFHVLAGDFRVVLRDVDFVGSLGYNRLLVVLPMTIEENAQVVARKVRDGMCREVALPGGERTWVRPRIGIVSFDRQDGAGVREVMTRLTQKWQEDL